MKRKTREPGHNLYRNIPSADRVEPQRIISRKNISSWYATKAKIDNHIMVTLSVCVMRLLTDGGGNTGMYIVLPGTLR